MVLLRDLSIAYSFAHIFVLFQFLIEPRYSKKKTRIISACFVVPLLVINWLMFLQLGYEGYGTLMLLTLSLPQGIMYYLLSRHRDGRFFFTYCMVDTIALEVFYATNIINSYTTPDTFIVMFVLRLALYPLLELFVYRSMRDVYLDVQKHTKRGWGFFAILGVLFYIAITLLMTFPDFITNRPGQIPVLILLFILMPAIYYHIISTLRYQQIYYEQKGQEKFMQLQVANITARIEELGEANESFRKERHDFRHKLKAIASLVETKQFDELAKVVKEYETNIQRTQVIRYCKSAIIDAVLSVYINKAKATGIEVDVGFAFPETFLANESELATALANAIENAINACEKLPQEERHIEIKVLSRPKFMVMVRNSFDGNIEFDENGIPINREDGHGIGSQSIATFCNKIGGYYEFRAEDNVFTLFMHLK